MGVGNGDITVGPSGDDQAISGVVSYSIFRPAVHWRATATGTFLEGPSCSWLGNCSAELNLTVPAGQAVKASSGSGNVSAANVDGALTLSAGSGDVSVERVSGGSGGSAGCQNGSMRVHVMGTRGSTPSPGGEFLRYGGHTSCLALAHGHDAPTLIIDAGTGIRRASALMDGEPFRGAILLGHLHWDHTQGMPFFSAGDAPGSNVVVYAPAQIGPAGEPDIASVLARAMSPPHFPITPTQLRGEWRFVGLEPGEREVEGFTVLALEIPHKGGRTFGYRVSDGESTLAYLSDHCPTNVGPGPTVSASTTRRRCAWPKGATSCSTTPSTSTRNWPRGPASATLAPGTPWGWAKLPAPNGCCCSTTTRPGPTTRSTTWWLVPRALGAGGRRRRGSDPGTARRSLTRDWTTDALRARLVSGRQPVRGLPGYMLGQCSCGSSWPRTTTSSAREWAD